MADDWTRWRGWSWRSYGRRRALVVAPRHALTVLLEARPAHHLVGLWWGRDDDGYRCVEVGIGIALVAVTLDRAETDHG